MNVEPCDGEPEELIIDLDNGNVIMLTLKSKNNDPLFNEIIMGRLTPQTDGDQIYWSNGASLTLEEIIAMIRTANN